MDADAALNSWVPNNGYGYSAFLPLRTFGQKRPLFHFALDELPPNATVYRALFRARTLDGDGTNLNVDVIGLGRPWDEHQVTWNVPLTGQEWASPGAEAVGIDRLEGVVSSTVVAGGDRWWEWEVTSLVQDWLSGHLPNYGFMLVCNETDRYHEISFASKEYGQAAQLIVEHSSGPTDGDYTLRLYKGLNMVSLPICPEDAAIGNVLADIQDRVVRVWAFDASNVDDPWQMYEPGGSDNDLGELDCERGFWFEMATDANLTIQGTEPANVAILLHAGWNFVGYPTLAQQDIGAALDSIAQALELVWHYRAQDAPDPWKRYSASAPAWTNDLTKLSPGEGYWFLVTEDCELTIP